VAKSEESASESEIAMYISILNSNVRELTAFYQLVTKPLQ